MGWPVSHCHNDDERSGEVNGGRSPGAVEDGIAVCVVHIDLRRQETGYDKQNGGDCGLQPQSALVVADSTQGPKQDQRQSDVKGREQAYPEWITHVPHVIRPTDEIPSRREPPANVQDPKKTWGQRSDRLA